MEAGNALQHGRMFCVLHTRNGAELLHVAEGKQSKVKRSQKTLKLKRLP